MNFEALHIQSMQRVSHFCWEMAAHGSKDNPFKRGKFYRLYELFAGLAIKSEASDKTA
jgi:hypothetical protein